MIRNIFIGNIKHFQNIIHHESIKASTVGFLVKKDLFQNCNRNFCSSAPEDRIPIAYYDEIVNLPKCPEKLLIDVREPEELKATGMIPTSINIPCKIYFFSLIFT